MPIDYEQNRSLIRAGGAVVYLRPRQKRPYNDGWQESPVLTWAEVKAHLDGSRDNLGIRLGRPSRICEADGTFVGFLRGLDLDVRKHDAATVAEAHAALLHLIGDTEGFAISRSGSGGPSRHFFFLSDDPDRTFKIHSGVKFKDTEGHSHWTWEIEVGGTGKQFVLPGSVHPNSRLYEWDVKPANWAEIRFIAGTELAVWRDEGEAKITQQDRDDGLDELLKIARKNYSGWSDNEIIRILDDLTDYDNERSVEDRDGWKDVGFALKHYFEDDPERGFEIWDTFSQTSTKYNYSDQRRVWRSIKGKGFGKDLTIATLKFRADTAKEATLSGLLYEPEEITLPVSASRLQKIFKDIMSELEEERAPIENAWLLERNLNEDSGAPRQHDRHNIILYVEHDQRFKGCIAKNAFTGQIVRRADFKKPPFIVSPKPVIDPVNGDPWSDHDDIRLRNFMGAPPRGRTPGLGWKLTKEVTRDAVVNAAEKNGFHPVQDRLTLCGRKWDGRERLDDLFVRYLGCPDDAYHREVCRNFFIGAVMRAFEPGCKFDFVIILEGPEGVRKSTFVRTLAMDDKWYGTLEGDFSKTKEMIEKMMGIWIAEMAELVGMSPAKANDVKAFISNQEASIRFAYDVHKTVVPRQGVLMGTTNDKTYLSSPNGNRRFNPIEVRVSEIDTDGLRREIEQVWGEAVQAYQAMRQAKPYGNLDLYLTDDAAAKQALAIQADRKIETISDLNLELIREWLNTPKSIHSIIGGDASQFEDETAAYLPTRINVTIAWTQVLGRRIEDLDQRQVIMLSASLMALKWKHQKRRLANQTVHWHLRPKAHERDVHFGYIKIPD